MKCCLTSEQTENECLALDIHSAEYAKKYITLSVLNYLILKYIPQIIIYKIEWSTITQLVTITPPETASETFYRFNVENCEK